MRRIAASVLLPLALVLFASGPHANGQVPTPPVCTGLCLQQLPANSCPNNGTTSISGVVFAPNGVDPLPDVQVYVPNAAVDAFTPGVSCPVVGQPPLGQPLVGATTAPDGTFTILNAPVGTNIPLVIVSGRWRRQVVIPNTTACADTPMNVRFPRNQSEGDIPKFAIATGGVDSVECVLRKVGIDDSEFTDSTGTGRINLFRGDFGPGAHIDGATPTQATLMSTQSTLNAYDVLMLPCEGGAHNRPALELSNLVAFANAGGRVYSSHYAYSWMITNPPFDSVVNWTGSGQTYADNTLASVNPAFSGGQTLSTWLGLVGASTTPGKIPLQQIKHDFSSVNPPTQSWLTLDVTGNPVMQFVFDTPVAAKTNQCGRVLYNEYHVENPLGSNGAFPTECDNTGKMTAQEKLLEYSLFELTNDGGAAILDPTIQDFGTVAVGFNSPVQTFKWTNNSTFVASVTLLTGSGDFSVVGNNCTSVPGYGSCQISVVFNPSAIGPRTGTLTVGSGATTLTAALTGIGIPDLTITSGGLNFGNLDVGATLAQTLTVMNAASGPVTVPALVTTGDYTASAGCNGMLPAGASCTITVTFKPTTNGTRAGTLNVQTPAPGPDTKLLGNGLDFTMATLPTSGSAIAGYNSSTAVTTTPLSGFMANLTLSCSTNAPGSVCTLKQTSYASGAPTTTAVAISTTAQYKVIGYGGGFSNGWLALVGLGAGSMLWMRRRRSGRIVPVLAALLVFALSLGLSGCSGLLPAQNANYTAPGTYTYTITATDGFLVRSATYALKVTAN